VQYKARHEAERQARLEEERRRREEMAIIGDGFALVPKPLGQRVLFHDPDEDASNPCCVAAVAARRRITLATLFYRCVLRRRPSACRKCHGRRA
jgi:hypothetical protein